MQTKIHIFALCAVLCLTACAGNRKLTRTFSGAPGEIVIAEGMAPVIDNDILNAKKASLAEAQKNAVEMVVGVYITAETRVDKAVTIDAQILAKTQGYVTQYDILEEKRDGEFYRTKIKAVVKLEEISKDLKDLGLMVRPDDVGNPKTAVIIEETLDNAPHSPSEAEAAIAQELINKGYAIVESSDLSGEELEGVADGNKRYFQKLAERLNVEVLVIGKAESAFFTKENLGGFVSYRASLQARVIKARTSDLLLTASQQASGVDVVNAIAGRKSLQTVGKLVGQELAGAIAQRLKATSQVTVIVQKVGTLNDLTGLVGYLKKVPTVKSAAVGSFGESQAVLIVMLQSSDTDKITQALQTYPGNKLKILTYSKFQITVEFE